MVTYVYAIVEHVPAAAGGVLGVGGQPVRSLATGDLAAAVSDIPAAGALTAADLWAHELVVEALAAAGPVLPARFGSRLPDDAAVVAFITARAGALRSGLARVRGRAELAVRARRLAREPPAADTAGPVDTHAPDPGSPPGPRPAPGTAYLAGRADRARWVASLHETVHLPLMALAAAGRWDTARSRPWQATGAYLVDAGAVRGFAAAVAALAGRLESTALTCTGPWPPYSFAAVEPA